MAAILTPWLCSCYDEEISDVHWWFSDWQSFASIVDSLTVPELAAPVMYYSDIWVGRSRHTVVCHVTK